MLLKQTDDSWIALAVLLSVLLSGCGAGTQNGGSDPKPPGSNPTPSLTGISPTEVGTGSAGFTLTVNGTGFVPDSEVRWAGSALPTTFVGSEQLAATVSSSRLEVGVTVNITVLNPAPGGGTSGAATFTVTNPAPTLASISPDRTGTESAGFEIVVGGSGFLPVSTAEWDGSARTTTYVSGSELRATIPASDITAAGTHDVTVFNPTPGGGASTALTFTVENPTPSLTSLSPDAVEVGGPDFDLTIAGTGFVPTSTIEWEGGSRVTSFVSETELRAAIPAADIVVAGDYGIAVRSPAPGGGVSNTVLLSVTTPDRIGYVIDQFANDLIYDSVSKLLYFSIPGITTDGNSVGTLEPVNATLGAPVFIGSEPDKLALSDDGQFLYVDLDGAAAVRRLELATRTAGLQFALGSDSFSGPYFVEDMEVLPGNANSIAVSRMNKGISPRHAGVAIYENGVQLANVTARHTGSNAIEPSETAAVLYGYNNETTEFGFRRMDVGASGVTVRDVTSSMISGFGVNIEFDAGRIYSSTGLVVNPAGPNLAGSFSSIPFGAVVRPDSGSGLAFFAFRNSSGEVVLQIYNLTSFTFIQGFLLDGLIGRPRVLLRWETNGLAMLTDADEIIVLNSPTFFSVTAGGLTSGMTLDFNVDLSPEKWTRLQATPAAPGEDNPIRPFEVQPSGQ